jgi:hypothetical protein
MMGNYHVRFCSGGEAGDRPTDHSEADLAVKSFCESVFGFEAFQVQFGYTAQAAKRLMRGASARFVIATSYRKLRTLSKRADTGLQPTSLRCAQQRG